jgi:ABC-2 type transport system ATP-binding protein
VLAVGDAAFQQRCLDEFRRLRNEGRTIVLVTHDMQMVERFCHRALLLTDGEIELIGDPHDVGRRYLERNFETFHLSVAERAVEQPKQRAEIADLWLEDEQGKRVENVEHGAALHLRATIEVHEDVVEPIVDFWVDDDRDARVFATSTRPWPVAAPLQAGDRLDVRVEVENLLAKGRYHVGCSLLSGTGALDIVALVNRHYSFVVYGGLVYGLVQLRHELQVDGLRPQ